MKRILFGIFAAGMIALTGCDKGSSTAPSTNPAEPGETRKLTVTAPTEQNITRNNTDKFTVRVDRDNFKGPIDIEIKNLPSGVTNITQTMTIPEGKDSMEVTLQADAKATPVNDHKVQIVAKAKDMKEAVATFDLDVKAE